MMSRWFALSVALLLVFMLLISGALAIGTLTPLKPVLTAFESCADTICWLDINVQQTSPAEAVHILTEHGYISQDTIVYLAPRHNPLCDAVFGGSYLDLPAGISSIQLVNCPNLQLGDVWDIFGEPQLIAIDCFDTWVMWYDDNIAVLTYGDLLPRSSVFQIIFFHPATFDRPPHGVQWHGFTSYWRYQQLEPDIRDC